MAWHFRKSNGRGAPETSVGYETVDGTATSMHDYEAAKGVLTFAPGVERPVTCAVFTCLSSGAAMLFTVGSR